MDERTIWKRGTFPFKTLFRLSRRDFRFSRYRSRKVKGNFLNVYSSLSLVTDQIQALDKRQTRILSGAQWVGPIRNICDLSKIIRDIGMKQEEEFNGIALLQNFKWLKN